MFRLLLALTLLSVPHAAFSQPSQVTYNRISLGESASLDVENDLLIAELFAQTEGKDATRAADEVNRTIDWAVNVAATHAAVSTQTLGYQSTPIHRNNAIQGWRVSQSIRLESTDHHSMSDLIGRLQEQLKVQSVSYRLSDSQRRQHLDGLTETALQRFNSRAERIAESLGRSGFRLVQLAINDNDYRPMVAARGPMLTASADSGIAPPRLEAGTQRMTVTVSGEIELNEN
jgi:predicted secreted protein